MGDDFDLLDDLERLLHGGVAGDRAGEVEVGPEDVAGGPAAKAAPRSRAEPHRKRKRAPASEAEISRRTALLAAVRPKKCAKKPYVAPRGILSTIVKKENRFKNTLAVHVPLLRTAMAEFKENPSTQSTHYLDSRT